MSITQFYRSEKTPYYLLYIIMAALVLLVNAISISILYNTSIEQQKQRLVEIASSRARLIESMGRYFKNAAKGSSNLRNDKWKEAVLAQLTDAHSKFEGFATTGEFTLAERKGEFIDFLLSYRHKGLFQRKDISINSDIAKPMQLALSGQSGTIIDLDYRGVKVLAAFEPVDILNYGIVAKIDLNEINRPFIQAGIVSSGISLFLILLGTFLFYRIVTPIMTDLKEKNTQLSQEIIERKRFQEKLETSNRDLEQFAYVASHDLQAPIRSVINYAQLFEMHYKNGIDEKGIDYINRIVRNSIRMRNLINSLLAYSRIGTTERKFTEIDCNTIVQSNIDDLRLVTEETGAVITYDPLPEIFGDKEQITKLFENLISNGAKYCKRTPRIHISAKKVKSNWVFSVKDNGIGINEKFYNKIFIIFQRLHPLEQYSGTGLGLAICKRIVERHNGKIWVESIPEEGSTFYFTIPI